MNRFIGVDPSLTSTAMVAIDSNGEVVDIIDGLGYPLPDKATLWQHTHRETVISNGIVAFLNAPNQRSAIEGYSYGSKGKRLIQLGELGGIIRYELMKKTSNALPSIIPPTSLKKFATGKGNSDKAKMAVGAFKLWGFEHEDDNVIDAFCLAQMMRYAYLKIDMFEYQKKVLKEIKLL